VVVTKSDLVSPDDAEALEARLVSLNSRATRLYAQHGVVPVGSLFGISAMRADVAPKDVSSWLGGLANDAAAPASNAPKARHDHRIASASIEIDTPISASAFDFWLDMLLSFNGPDILRMKGIVHVEDLAWPFVFHGVQHIFDAPVPLKNWTGRDKTSRVVVIARNMDKSDLQASLNMLLMKPKDVRSLASELVPQTEEMPF